MKTFKVTIKIQSFFGTQIITREIKAKTLSSCQKKAYAIIGNQTGEIVFIEG